MCDRQLFGGPLVCTREDPHERGHVYVATHGNDDERGEEQ